MEDMDGGESEVHPEGQERDQDGDSDSEADGEEDGEEGEDSLDQNLIAFFDANLDEEGRLPDGADQMFAMVETREDSDAREAKYAARPNPRVEDYKPMIRKLAPYKKEGDEPDWYQIFADSAKMQANLGIRAMNDLLGTNMEEYALFKSTEDSEIVELLGSMGFLIGGSIAVGVSGVPLLASGAVAMGIAGLHSLMATYDDPENMEKHDGFITSLLGDGVIPQDTSEMTRLELGTRIWLADTVDFVTFGKVGRMFSKGKEVWKNLGQEGSTRAKGLMTAMEEAGAKRLKAAASQGKEPDLRRLSTQPTEVERVLAAESKEELREYVGDLAARVQDDPRVMETMFKAKRIRANMELDPARMDDFIAKTKRLRRSVKGLIPKKEFDAFKLPGTAADVALPLRRAWGAVEKSKGLSEDGLKRYIAHMDNAFDHIETEFVPKMLEEGASKLEVVDDSVRDLLKRRFVLVDTLLNTNFKKDFPDSHRRLLATAIEQTTAMSEIQLLNKGIDMRAHESLGITLRQMEKLEGAMNDQYTRRFTSGLDRADTAKLKNIQRKWAALYDSLLETDNDILSVGASSAMQVLYDNMLGKMALATATASGAAGFLGEMAYHVGGRNIWAAVRGQRTWGGVRRELFKSWPSRVVYNVKERLGALKDFDDIWSGKKLPRRYDKYGYQRGYLAKSRSAQAFNRLTGTSRTLMWAVDEVMSAFHDSISEVSAMDSIIRGTILPEARKGKYVGQNLSLEETRESVMTIAKRIDLARKDPDAFLKKYPQFLVHYMSESNFRTDAGLFRANPEDFPDPGWLGQLGQKIYYSTVHTLHHNPSIAGQTLGAALLPFPRVWANVLMHADHMSPLGALRGDPRRPWEMVKEMGAAMKERRRATFTLLSLGAIGMSRGIPDTFRVVHSGGDADDFRRWGGQDGLLLAGDKFVAFNDLGHVGVAMGAMYKFMDILETMPVTGDMMSFMGMGDDMTGTGDMYSRAGQAGLVMARHIMDDSFFERGMSTIFYGTMTGGKGEIFLRYMAEVGTNAVDVGGAPVKRIQAAVKREEDARAQPDLMPLASTREAIREFAEAVRGLDTVEARRDMLGVPMSRGESREDTRASVDIFGSLIYMWNPGKKGSAPKSNQLRDWFVANGALSPDTVHVGDKVLSKETFTLLFGMGPEKLSPANRRTNIGHVDYTLSPREYNDKLTFMSLDWEAAERILDRYGHYYENTAPMGAPRVREHRETARDIMASSRQYFRWGEMASTIRDFYSEADEGTRMVDVLHHIATARTEDMSQYAREVVEETRNALVLTALENREYNDTLRDLTDQDIMEMGERMARVTLMKEFYRHMDSMASAVMRYAPGTDETISGDFNTQEE